MKAHAYGRVDLFRYADDVVISCGKEDATRIKNALSKRLAKFKLRLNEEKTFQEGNINKGKHREYSSF